MIGPPSDPLQMWPADVRRTATGLFATRLQGCACREFLLAVEAGNLMGTLQQLLAAAARDMSFGTLPNADHGLLSQLEVSALLTAQPERCFCPEQSLADLS